MLYKAALTLGLLMVLGGPVVAEEGQHADPLIAAHVEKGATPEGALELWFDAVLLYLDEESRDQAREAIEYLTIRFKDEPKWDGQPSNRIFVERLRDPAYSHIFRSYAVGTNPENAYSIGPAGFDLNVEESAEDKYGRGWRILLRSSGADASRPVYMKRSTSTGLWYVSEFANVYVGIRPPHVQGEERFE